ncbi:MAG: EscU/YscU/HrcU family type III secretion system export apparatus switch protein [Actinobacteria bacterium]|nr:EscU/YscU/HrcU family type III secretion system export apparatus switch protein [Actinomycetota bacterium]
MADNSQKTEPPTPKRRKDARRKGQVARSQELGAFFGLLVATMLLPAFFNAAASRLEILTAQAFGIVQRPSVGAAVALLRQGMLDVAALALPLAGALMAIGLILAVAQVRIAFSPSAMLPQFSRLNPLAGIKKIFALSGLWQLLKQSIKLLLVGVLAFFALKSMIHTLIGSRPVALLPLLDYAGSAIMSFLRDMALAALVLAFADYLYQRHQLSKSLRMTKHEVKEENRQHDLPPEVKRALRRRQYRLSRMRMMAEVARASVVVTNPTHLAVAITYEKDHGRAPTVVAKGEGNLAFKIREEASKHGVPIVEDPPLARAVYSACDLGQEIPRELYLAVARLLAFVYALSPLARSTVPVHRRPISSMVA